jgi:hydroxymethylpyrimidine pyrophosphatase-like HAD family hydrolase
MRYHALACDYDGTLANEGRVVQETVAALERLRAAGRKLILVTGRELEDLLSHFPQVHVFSRVVAENGGVLYEPALRKIQILGPAPPKRFLAQLRARNVSPLAVGHVIVATSHPHEKAVLDAILTLGLEMQLIYNKDAVMALPSGVNKATGLGAALTELGLSPQQAVGVGDAENDQAFLNLCRCAVAVANALPAVKQYADLVTRGEHGAGVVELINLLLENDLAVLEGKLTRHHLPIESKDTREEIRLPCEGSRD